MAGLSFDNLDVALRYQRRVRDALYKLRMSSFGGVDEMLKYVPLDEADDTVTVEDRLLRTARGDG